MFLSVKNEFEVPFKVRVVYPGERYGRDNCLVHEDMDPLVEFYDERYPFCTDPEGVVLGQFVSRYFASTIANATGGLQLDGAIAEWGVSSTDMDKVREWLEANSVPVWEDDVDMEW
ncbi:hypothetical protein [Spongiibacter sp.]|uniref:hypothetical protein n=1 Tax=Spongiibacter sp. TaxID=2024860 RepID=UPI00257CDDCB|nr:hypothetical protein [Spongiibacter sp.]